MVSSSTLLPYLSLFLSASTILPFSSHSETAFFPSTHFLAIPRRHGHVHSDQSVVSSHSATSTSQCMVKLSSTSTVEQIHEESELLRKEIDELRKEALCQLQALDDQLNSQTDTVSTVTSYTPSSSSTIPSIPVQAGLESKKLQGSRMSIIDNSHTKTHIKRYQGKKKISDLLDETKWKISLNIGREPGTWMPKAWGESGQRLNLSFTIEFTPSQLYERDDFLRAGFSNAKVLHCIQNQGILGPSINEGQREFKIKDGGWQITRGDGPVGTDLLRFFIELDQDVTHTDCDLYIPKGRVFCSCGFFPFVDSASDGGTSGSRLSVKESFAKELQDIQERIVLLREKKYSITNPFSLEGIKISRDIGQLRRQAEQVNRKLNFAMVREPDKKLLRFTKDEDVGLTREGGVCCRVEKGAMVEYHILGRFSIASAEHDD